jgi:hypothetical protein
VGAAAGQAALVRPVAAADIDAVRSAAATAKQAGR